MEGNRFVITTKPDGWYGMIRCFPGDTLSLEELQGMVEGHIETVPTVIKGWSYEPDVDVVMLANEEGKLQGLPENFTAMLMSARADVIVGNVVIMGAKDDELIGLTQDAAENIIKAWIVEE